MHMQPERLYFLFALGIIHGDRCDRTTPKQFFYSSKQLYSVVESSNTVELSNTIV